MWMSYVAFGMLGGSWPALSRSWVDAEYEWRVSFVKISTLNIFLRDITLMIRVTVRSVIWFIIRISQCLYQIMFLVFTLIIKGKDASSIHVRRGLGFF